MTSQNTDTLELFKLLDIETEKDREKYKNYVPNKESDSEVKEVTFVRTGYDTTALGEIDDAKLESDS